MLHKYIKTKSFIALAILCIATPFFAYGFNIFIKWLKGHSSNAAIMLASWLPLILTILVISIIPKALRTLKKTQVTSLINSDTDHSSNNTSHFSLNTRRNIFLVMTVLVAILLPNLADSYGLSATITITIMFIYVTVAAIILRVMGG